VKAILCLICTLLQTGLVFAQSSEQSYEDQLRELRELSQRIMEELAHSRPPTRSPTPTEEVKTLNTRSVIREPTPEKPKLILQAKAYHLLGVLSEEELDKVRQKDMLRLASRGQDYIPQDNPVLARIAEHVGITVSDWFARLPPSDVVGRIEPEPSSTASTSVPVPEPAPPSGPEPRPPRATPSETPSRPPSASITPTPVARAPGSIGPPPAEVEGLLKHGKDLFATGDIAGARALFLRAATGNDPSALTALAQTYDPQVLGSMRVRGVKPDPSKAKALYEQAEAARKRH
jgi:hypothetical protein